MVAHFLQAFKIFTESGINVVADELRPCAILNAALSVKEPFWDAIVQGPGEDVGDLVLLSLGKLSGASGEVDLGNFAHKVGESSTNSLDNSESKHDFVLAVHIGVLHSQNVGELLTWIF